MYRLYTPPGLSTLSLSTILILDGGTPVKVHIWINPKGIAHQQIILRLFHKCITPMTSYLSC